jgi:hypothetical protein
LLRALGLDNAVPVHKERIVLDKRSVLIIADDGTTRMSLSRIARDDGLRAVALDSRDEIGPPAAEIRPRTLVVHVGTPGYDGDVPWRARAVLDALWPDEPEVVIVDDEGLDEAGGRIHAIGARFMCNTAGLQAVLELVRIVDDTSIRPTRHEPGVDARTLDIGIEAA